jgi:hypothetical protein
MGWKTTQEGSFPTGKRFLFLHLFSLALSLCELRMQIIPWFLPAVVKRPERHADSYSCVKVKKVKKFAAMHAIHLHALEFSERILLLPPFVA